MASPSAAAAAAGWLVSPLLQYLHDRASACAADLLRYLPAGTGDASADLGRLSDQLLRLHATASAIERARRRPSDPTLVAWLRRLKDAAHDAEDLLDDIDYGRLADSRAGAAPRGKLRHILDSSRTLYCRVLCPEEPLRRLPSVLDELAAASAAYGEIAALVKLDAAASPRYVNCLTTNSSSIVPADDTFFGRGRELADLLGRLVGCNGAAQLGSQIVPVVAIVGDGGIGKTTLAQMAFNHVSIQSHFDLKMWVCVSSRVDVVEFTREILQLASERKEEYDGVVNFDRLQQLLVSAVAGKRFLLILDDVWDDNGQNLWQNTEMWKKLLAPLQNGQQGSRIVVTTRMKMVADMLGVRIPVMLAGMGTEEHWLLLKKCALGCEKIREYPQLQEIGRKIALKLRGSPLAARVIGGMLSVTRSAREWDNILDTDIHGDIVSTLLSSYYHLPPHLQYCFAYCSIFPKSWKFEPKKLIGMWIAQGFIQVENGTERSMEHFGREYFKELLSRSFFQTLKQGNKMLYFMHDLIHDLAQMVSYGDCGRIQGNMWRNIVPTIRHLSASSNSLGQLKNQCDLKRLRTLIVIKDPLMPVSRIPDSFLAETKNLRVLDFTECNISELPEAIGQLTHLRYLALPDTIKTLPESLARLMHLQDFYIPKKCQLDRFPEDMHLLTSLRQLGIDSKYISMIRGIGSLVNLQGSLEFHVKKQMGHTIEELKDMNKLHGVLYIKNLENVQCKEEACKAGLANKRYVKILKLEWNYGSIVSGPIIAAEVLDFLQPHPNLEELHITRYKGSSSPRWLENKMMSHLKSLYLTNCRRWTLLPPLGQLPYLRLLYLKEMSSVSEIGLQFYGGGTTVFPSLKDLEFDDMPNLVCWRGETSESFFPRLQNLKVSNCPKLIEMPLLPPTTKHVTMEGSLMISRLKLSPYFSSKSRSYVLEISSASILSKGFLHQKQIEVIEILNIRGCWGAMSPEKFLELTSLRKLQLCQCDIDSTRLNLTLQHLTGLASLEIIECQNVRSFVPVGLRYFTKLEHLNFHDCLMLSSLATLERFIFLKSLVIERCPRVTAESLPADLKKLVSLNKLSISHCPGFQSLPNSIPLSLEFLQLIGCDPMLTKGLLEKQGPDWAKISFIPQITIH